MKLNHRLLSVVVRMAQDYKDTAAHDDVEHSAVQHVLQWLHSQRKLKRSQRLLRSDLSYRQAEVVKRMRAGETLHDTVFGPYLAKDGKQTMSVHANTFRGLVRRKAIVRDGPDVNLQQIWKLS